MFGRVEETIIDDMLIPLGRTTAEGGSVLAYR